MSRYQTAYLLLLDCNNASRLISRFFLFFFFFLNLHTVNKRRMNRSASKQLFASKLPDHVVFFRLLSTEETLCVLVTIDSKSRVDRWIDLSCSIVSNARHESTEVSTMCVSIYELFAGSLSIFESQRLRVKKKKDRGITFNLGLFRKFNSLSNLNLQFKLKIGEN